MLRRALRHEPPRPHQRSEELAEAMVLTDVLDRKVRDLSGGMQRRLQAATAMVHRPSAPLLDEPTVGAYRSPGRRCCQLVRRAPTKAWPLHTLPTTFPNSTPSAPRSPSPTTAGRSPGAAWRCYYARRARPARLRRPPAHIDPRRYPGASIQVNGSEMTIAAANPASVVGAIVSSSPEVAVRLRRVEVHPASLDDLYRHLLSGTA